MREGTDRISLCLGLPADWREAVDAFRDYVGEQTLATELRLSSGEPLAGSEGRFREVTRVGGHEIEIELARLGS